VDAIHQERYSYTFKMHAEGMDSMYTREHYRNESSVHRRSSFKVIWCALEEFIQSALVCTRGVRSKCSKTTIKPHQSFICILAITFDLNTRFAYSLYH
jgi:hypothetical protein